MKGAGWSLRRGGEFLDGHFSRRMYLEICTRINSAFTFRGLRKVKS